MSTAAVAAERAVEIRALLLSFSSSSLEARQRTTEDRVPVLLLLGGVFCRRGGRGDSSGLLRERKKKTEEEEVEKKEKVSQRLRKFQVPNLLSLRCSPMRTREQHTWENVQRGLPTARALLVAEWRLSS